MGSEMCIRDRGYNIQPTSSSTIALMIDHFTNKGYSYLLQMNALGALLKVARGNIFSSLFYFLSVSLIYSWKVQSFPLFKEAELLSLPRL